MKKYENYNLIQKIDIQDFSGLETEISTHFLNHVEKSFPLTSSCCGITFPTPNYYIKRSPATVFVLEHVISGKGYVVVNGQKHTVTTGDTYLLKPTENCEYFADKQDPYKKIWVNFNGNLAHQIISQYQLQDTIYKNVDLSPSFKKLFKLEEISTDLDVIHYDITSIITEMLMLLAKSKNSAKQASQIAIATKSKLNACATKTFSLDEIAKELFVSKTEIIRYFKKAYNTTPYQYLLNIKINHAKIMLENGTYSVIEISNQLAFSNPYHFSKIFKQKIGLSPSEYRKKPQGQ
jgi:AraC-like DNA-binding protein